MSIGPPGAFGVFLHKGIPFAVTLERTFDPDDHVKIPPGTYQCERSYFYRGGYNTYEITGVEGHSRLLFHRGNKELDSEGCVLVGRRYGMLREQPAILESAKGFAEFMGKVGAARAFPLVVTEVL